MSAARNLAVILLLITAGASMAGTIHPALQAELDNLTQDQYFSVIVHMSEQAPIASINEDLKVRKASRKARHEEVITALQSVTDSQRSLRDRLDADIMNGSVLGYTGYWISNLLVVHATKAEIEQIASRPDVAFVEANFTAELIEPVGVRIPSDNGEIRESGERGIGVTPGLRAIRAPEVWYQLGYNGTGVLIGGLDTGVDGNHPALNTRWRGYNGQEPWQECWLDVLGSSTQFPSDGNDHGTHTMGTMTGLGAATDDTIGVAWGAKWISCNAINQGVGSAFDNDILTAFQWFADPDGNAGTEDDVPDVVQNSWGVYEGLGYSDCFDMWWNVIDNCEAAGVCVTWSAGNEGSGASTLRSPPDRATTIYNSFSVGAVNATNYSWPYPIATWSSRGPSTCPGIPSEAVIKPEVVAPGVTVYSSVPGGGYEQTNWSGTSMAGPHVAGVVALMREANPDIDVDTIKQIIMDTARDEGTTGEDNTFGWGFIDAYAAVIAATTGFGEIQGHVRNASWGAVPIADAEVELLDTGHTFTTDLSGYYHGTAPAGTQQARASAVGFAPQTADVELVANEMTTQDFFITDIAGPTLSNLTPGGITTDTSGPYVFTVKAIDFSTVAEVRLYYRANNGAWESVAMNLVVDTYSVSLPGRPAGTKIDYYAWAEDGPGLTSVYPVNAPLEYHSLYVAEEYYSYNAEDPDDPGWIIGAPGDAASSGIWERVDPIGTNYNGTDVQPEDDHTPSPGVKCFVTENGSVGGAVGEADVDDGCTTLFSPTFDLSGAEKGFVTYWRWYGETGNSTDDEFAVDVSSNGGTDWVELERVPNAANSWNYVFVDLSTKITLTDQVVFRFVACDLNTGGLVEAGIDDFSIVKFTPFISGTPEIDVSAPVAKLSQNQPNPFHPSTSIATTISFRLSNPAHARLDIYDAGGRLVRTLVDRMLQSGTHNIPWNGEDDLGNSVGSGVYFYRLDAGAFVQSRRLTLLK
ncbi:MAG: S8 family serine peptidase [Candidatus Eisenbacteria bacterium]|uniref:S8 family serine peptidase n=1 Tax=Eiseniibacteriota bacterium TaxID=2212470 RepID=A0A948RYP0_UNCEI|nr:S8 family serine peptidase [Candidatus Eisenbacteria bacterium]MBU1950675.1 S8 family serine peptidase [Candidatus Eisenbacteria bacterium]MBU2693270.1 S8 family serine peptidase [Candidatus Eisenbacteria bacterium]